MFDRFSLLKSWEIEYKNQKLRSTNASSTKKFYFYVEYILHLFIQYCKVLILESSPYELLMLLTSNLQNASEFRQFVDYVEQYCEAIFSIGFRNTHLIKYGF